MIRIVGNYKVSEGLAATKGKTHEGQSIVAKSPFGWIQKSGIWFNTKAEARTLLKDARSGMPILRPDG